MPFGPISGAGGGSLNVPDDHRFSTTAQRDAAIPSPKEGEQCTIESAIPQYHLLQEYRGNQWVDITYIITGPRGEQGPKGESGSKSIVLDSSTTYSTVEELLSSQNKILLDKTGNELLINLNIPTADLDNEQAGTVYFYVLSSEMNIVTGYVRNVVTGSLFRLEPGSQYFFYYDKPSKEFVNLLCFNGIAVYPNQLLDFSSTNWRLPDGNRTLFLPEGTIRNLDDHVNNRQASAIVEIVSVSDRSLSSTSVCSHVVTLISSDSVANGTQWIRTAKSKSDIISAPFLELTGASENRYDPSDGFNLKSGKTIIVEDGAELRQLQGSDITAVFNSGTHNITEIDGDLLKIGTSQGAVELKLYSSKTSIPIYVGGYQRHMAFQENCVEDIQEGTGIKVNSTDTNKPIVSIDPGVVKDPSEGFELKADKTIEVLSSAEIVLHRGSFLSGKFSDDNVHRIIDFGVFGSSKDQIRFGNHLIDVGLQLESSQRFIYAIVNKGGTGPLRYTVAVNAMSLTAFTKGASIYELEDGTNYVGIDRQTPVTVTEAIDNLCLVKITDPEVIEDDEDGVPTVTQLPKVRKGNYGDLASGFSLCPGGADADSEIIQIASGTYSLEQMTFAAQAEVEDLVYVGEDGKLTLAPSEHIAGWVINGGVVIDIDLYNGSLNDKKSDSFDELVTRVLKVHEGPESPDNFSQVYIDGNKNTTFHSIGDTHFYRKDPESKDLTEIFQIDNANRFIVKTKIKVPVITNAGSGTTNSNSEKAAFIDFGTENRVNIGAYDKVTISVGGVKTSFGGDTISFSDIGEGYIRNIGLISRNSSNDRNGIIFGEGELVYKSNTHSYKDNDDVDLFSFDQTDFNFFNRNLKKVRHLVGNTPGTMFVANLSKIKRDDDENEKDVIDFAVDSITTKSKKIEFKDDTNSRRLTIESHKADWHGCQLNNLADGVENGDAATVGQLNALAGIPYIRKFDSTGGQLFAHNYPENRFQAWINYKGDGVNELSLEGMRSIPEGQTGQMYDMVAVDNQSQNICKLRLFYEGSSTLLRVLPGEVVQCWTSREFKRWKWQYGTDTSPTGNTSLAIDDNNLEIINPTQGNQFQLTDSNFDSGYGKDNQLTYYAPVDGDSQNNVIVNHLDSIRSFVIHRGLNTTQMYLMLHQDYVAELYDREVSGIDQLTMLFGTKSRGRFGKSNQTAPDGAIWNWNGDAIPSDVNANAINPGRWIDKDGNETATWSKSGILNACYSSGGLYNDGSATLTRGDVFYDKATETTSFTARNDSEFFILPIKSGGGTFSAIKIFPFFMDRYEGTQDDWDSYTFDNLADCVGTILKISYDAAIESTQSKDNIQTELFKMAAATVAEYPESNFVIKTEE